MSDDESGRDFALEVVRRLQQARLPGALGGGLRARPHPGSDARRITTWRPTRLPNRSWRSCRSARSPSGSRSASCGSGIRTGPGAEVEVATFRSDGAYVDGRRPESVVFSSPELDAARRDFTINGMFLDPLTDTLIDYVGGHAGPEESHPPRHRRPRGPIPRGQAARCCARSACRRGFSFRSSPPLWPRSSRWPARSSPSPRSESPRNCEKCSCMRAGRGPWSWLSRRAWSPPSCPICCR